MANPTYSDPDSLDFIDLLEYDELQQTYDPQRNPHSCAARPNRSCDDQRCCSSAIKGNGIPLSQELDEADRKLFNPGVPASSTSVAPPSSHNAIRHHQESAELFLRLDSNDSVARSGTDPDTPVTTAEFFGGEELQYENEFEDDFSGAVAAGFDDCSARMEGFSLGENENEQLLLEGTFVVEHRSIDLIEVRIVDLGFSHKSIFAPQIDVYRFG